MNRHLQHIEEAVLFGGAEGARKASNMFYGLLTGETKLTMKMDGSPAIVCGTDPMDGKFFVSTKSFFNKTPVMYKSWSELRQVEPRGLQDKLIHAFNYLKEMKFPGYLQGDLLFGPDDLTYNVESDWFRAQPNTLVYGFEREYEFGIAFHTHYNYNMEVSYDFDFSVLKHPDSNVLLFDTSVVPYIPDVNWTPLLKVNTLDVKFADEIAAHPHMGKLISQFFNTKIRAGVTLSHPEMLEEMGIWFYARFQNDILKLKTESAKQKRIDEQWSCMEFFSRLNRPKMLNLLSFIQDLTVLKHDCINRLDKSPKIKTWVIRDNEYVPTGPEGYVVSRGGEAYKLVDRTKFSYYNFSPDFVKGWDEPKRT